MKLDDWFKANPEVSNADFAKAIGVTRQAVARYRADRVPRPNQISAIRDATGGKVTANDFMRPTSVAPAHDEAAA